MPAFFMLFILVDNLRKIISETLSEVFDNKGSITVYHGTHPKYVNDIKSQGLKSKALGPNWYMVATDFESALYHATPEGENDVVVFEFEVPVENTKWEGYPYFWPPYERSEKSSWFALKEPLGNELIKKVHHISYEDYLKQKSKGF